MLGFLGIGAQKAGTTWLFGALRQHPEVWFPPLGKEVHFFDTVHLRFDGLPRLRRARLRSEARLDKLELSGKTAKAAKQRQRISQRYDPQTAYSAPWYRALYDAAPAGRKTGDITPYYCALPAEGIAEVQQMMPDTPILYLIRDPLERALSSVRMMAGQRKKKPEALLANPDFWARGDYASNIARWDAAFGADQILYVPFGEIRDEPEALLCRIEAHLGLAPYRGYKALHDKKKSSASGDWVLSEALRSQISEAVAPQYAYLRARFGSAFCDRIR
jgi:hypothetical protein